MRFLFSTIFFMVFFVFATVESSKAASVSECIASTENGPSCLGKVTKACLSTEKEPVDDTVHECYQSEYVQWDLIVIKSARSLEKILKGNALETFRVAQKAWTLYRTKSCRLPYQTLKGRAALVAGLTCNRDVTARRALGLAAFLKVMK